jgi:hypothetical protein
MQRIAAVPFYHTGLRAFYATAQVVHLIEAARHMLYAHVAV